MNEENLSKYLLNMEFNEVEGLLLNIIEKINDNVDIDLKEKDLETIFILICSLEPESKVSQRIITEIIQVSVIYNYIINSLFSKKEFSSPIIKLLQEKDIFLKKYLILYTK